MTRPAKAAPTRAELARLRSIDQIHFEMENQIHELREATQLLNQIIGDTDQPPVWLARAIARMADGLGCLYYRSKKEAP